MKQTHLSELSRTFFALAKPRTIALYINQARRPPFNSRMWRLAFLPSNCSKASFLLVPFINIPDGILQGARGVPQFPECLFVRTIAVAVLQYHDGLVGVQRALAAHTTEQAQKRQAGKCRPDGQFQQGRSFAGMYSTKFREAAADAQWPERT